MAVLKRERPGTGLMMPSSAGALAAAFAGFSLSFGPTAAAPWSPAAIVQGFKAALQLGHRMTIAFARLCLSLHQPPQRPGRLQQSCKA